MFRSIHPFPARMAPEIVLRVLDGDTGRKRVLDPMAGSGTTVVSARMRGYRAYGVDSDPLAVMISSAASSDFDEERFRSDSNRLLKRARIALRKMCDAEAYPVGADEETKEFIRYWFDRRSRRQLAAIVTALGQGRYRTRPFLLCAFSRMIITKKGGVSLAWDVSHSRPHRKREVAPVAPFRSFMTNVEAVTRRAHFQGDGVLPRATVLRGDCRRLRFKARMFDFIITSPPYLNAIDYLRGHKMSLVWFGHPIKALRRLRAKSVGSEVGSAASTWDHVVDKMVAQPDRVPSRLRGIMRRYVHDMSEAISEMKRVAKKGCRVVLVVGDCTVRGTEIRNSSAIDILCKNAGMTLARRKRRPLQRQHRYLPPPSERSRRGQITERLWDEVILEYDVA